MKIPSWLKTLSRHFAPRPAVPTDVAGLIRRYGTNPAYTKHYWNHVRETHAAHPRFDLIVEAELGGRMRSHEHIRFLSRYFHDRRLIRGKDCLDIGCSSGHALVAFREQGARRAVGVEVDEGRLATAALNIDGCPSSVRKGIQLIQSGIETIGPVQLGRFDVIFCNDVLEHVADRSAALTQIARLLNDGPAAFAFVSLHNCSHPLNVLHEPHYDMPGLTIMPRDLAERLFLLFRTDESLRYEVNDWASFAECRAQFSAQNKNCALFPPSPPDDAEIDGILSLAGEIRPRFDGRCQSAKVPDILRKQAGEFIDGYLLELETAARTVHSGASPEAREAFHQRFGSRVLNMIVTNRRNGLAP